MEEELSHPIPFVVAVFIFKIKHECRSKAEEQIWKQILFDASVKTRPEKKNLRFAWEKLIEPKKFLVTEPELRRKGKSFYPLKVSMDLIKT